jgi:hypothetical protein
LTSHDQLSKSLLRNFFTDFFCLVAPECAPRLRLEDATFVDKEVFTDWPVGDRREVDLLAEVPVEGETLSILVHVEIETEFRAGIDHRLWHYYMLLRLRHRRAVYPVLLTLRGGPPGLRPGFLREGFHDKMTAIFLYRQLGLSGCPAREWLSRPEPIAWAFAALMRPEAWSRAEHKLECLRRIAQSDVTGLRKQLLVDWVETYVQLTEDDARELQRLLDLEGNEEIKAMELTWLGQAEARGMEKGIAQGLQQGIAQGLQRGLAQGSQTATQQAVERMRRVVFRQIEQRFGTVPAPVRQKIEATESLEPLATLAERVLVVASIDDLVQH